MAKTQISRRGGSRRRGGTRKGGFKKRGGTRKGGFRKRGGTRKGGFRKRGGLNLNPFKFFEKEKKEQPTKPEVDAPPSAPVEDAPPSAPVEEEVVMEESSDLDTTAPEAAQGGRPKKSKKDKKTKMNGFFTAMLKAKKNGDKQFKYKGKTYKRHKSKTGLDVYKHA